MRLIKRRENKMISDGNKINEVTVIWEHMILLNLKDFMKKQNLKDNARKESDLRRAHNYPI